MLTLGKINSSRVYQRPVISQNQTTQLMKLASTKQGRQVTLILFCSCTHQTQGAIFSFPTMGLYVDKKDGQGNLLSYIKSNFKCRHQNCQIGIVTFANERKNT